MMHRTLLLGVLLASAHAVASSPDSYVELARSCSQETSAQNKLTIATTESMIELTGPHVCIDRMTRTKLAVTGMRTYKNRFGSASLELTLTPESSAKWMELQKVWLGKEFVLLSGQRSILYGRVLNESSEDYLTLFAKDEPEAKQIAAALVGKVNVAP